MGWPGKGFASHFTDDASNESVVAFANLSGDAILVAPSPRGPGSVYGYIAAFVRNASARQQHCLWRTASQTVQRALADHPRWISTAGGGVAWLYVRSDSRPKYYGYAAYRVVT